MQPYFLLKKNIVAEPLIDQWYAQPLLIPPITAALLTANIHLPIMSSYINEPGSHEAALEWPEMRGGPFIDYPERQVDAISDLLDKTKKQRANSLQLAHAIKELAFLLETEAKGHSLLELYQKIPSPLKGYIELGYDLMNQPFFRLFETLLYKSDYYLEDGQSVLLSETLTDHRPFCLSTPRLMQNSAYTIKLPFKSNWYDRFFAARFHLISEDSIKDLYEEVSTKSEFTFENFKQFFFQSNTQHSLPSKPTSEEVRIRYFGHACLLFETSKISILTDVVLGYTFPNCSPRYSHLDLPEKIDYLLITHTHQDHIQIEHLLQLRHKIETVIVPNTNHGAVQDPSLKLLFEALGFKKVISINDMEEIPIPGGSITGIPFMGEHGDIDIKSKSAYALHLNKLSVLCLADANAIDTAVYQNVHNVIGDMDILFLSLECEGAPMSWLYNAFQIKELSWAADQSRRLDASDYNRAMTMIQIFHCKEVYIYGMGQEPWLNHIMNIELEPNSIQQLEIQKLKNTCEEMNIHFEVLHGHRNLHREY